MRFRSLLLAAGLCLVAGQGAQAGSIMGNWLTHKSKAMVKITPCGGGLCGQIVWLRDGQDSKGRPVRDARNRDQRLRGRQVLGLRTFSGLKPAGAGRWSGLIYNPEDGRTYRASLTMTSDVSIRVEGCRVQGSACGGRNWVRAR